MARISGKDRTTSLSFSGISSLIDIMFKASIRKESVLKILLIFGSLLIIYRTLFSKHLGAALNHFMFNDDARQQIFPLFGFIDRELFSSDYIARYFLNVVLPLGYKGLYRLGALIVDPETLSKILPYILWLYTMTVLARLSWKIGGAAGAWVTLLFAIGSPIFFERMIGGLPRSFGFPIVATALLGLVEERVVLLITATVCGALFYPVSGIISGLSLAWYLLFPEALGGSSKSRPLMHKAIILVSVCAVSLVVIYPQLNSSAQYGPMLRPADQIYYPEIGEGGRYGASDLYPKHGIQSAVSNIITQSVIYGRRSVIEDSLRRHKVIPRLAQDQSTGVRQQILLWITCLLLVVTMVTAYSRKEDLLNTDLIKLIPLFVIGLVSWQISKIFFPLLYLPERYLIYVIPLLALVFIPALIASALKYLVVNEENRAIAQIWMGAVLYSLIAQSSNYPYGYNYSFYGSVKSKKEAYNFVSGLPKSAVIAGWPTGFLDSVSYLTRRPTWITKEVHQVFHLNYVQEMRRRISLLVAAYFAHDLKPILDLRDRAGVTHLVVELKYLVPGNARYFKPFDQEIDRLVTQVPYDSFIMPTLVDRGAVYKGKGLFIIDLSLLGH